MAEVTKQKKWRYITVTPPPIDLRVNTPRPPRKRTKGKGSS